MNAIKHIEIWFDYNLAIDTPEKIAEEMKKELNLNDLEIVEIAKEISKIVK